MGRGRIELQTAAVEQDGREEVLEPLEAVRP